MPSKKATTAARILEAARRLFNEKGYDATTLSEIAKDVGIRQGNLTYHYPTKHDLVLALREALMARVHARTDALEPGAVADDTVEHMVFMLGVSARYRCLLRDRMRFDDAPKRPGPTPEMVAALDELRGLLVRIRDEGYLRRDLDVELDALADNIYIVGRYWPDHLREMEGRAEMSEDDLARGASRHLSVLLPHLTAPGRRAFEAAFARQSQRIDGTNRRIGGVLTVR